MLQNNWLVILLLLGMSSLGGTALVWTRLTECPLKMQKGRWLFMISLITFGVFGAVAALYLHHSLISIGLLMAFLFIAMLWDGPTLVVTPGE